MSVTNELRSASSTNVFPIIRDGAPIKVLLVYPRFISNSFWNFRETCDAVGASYPAPPLGLITVAAMLPAQWPVSLVDTNTKELHDADIAACDIVFISAMLPQQTDALAIIERSQRLGKRCVMGGPDVSSSPHIYKLANFRVIGEAENVMADLVEAIERGDKSGDFEAKKFSADVTSTPIPRYDLLKFTNYLHIGLQFSRGCPFNCEFCDIIELYGRVPRAKTVDQVLMELGRLHELGYRGHVDFVDDNLIGNKKALRLLLPHLIAWQKERDYPFEFSTEASVNLADDEGLLFMLREANFFVIFVGIETPDIQTLIATQKKQNTRHSLVESIQKIYRAGIFVHAGFIIGFDTERGSIRDAMLQCIEDTAIPVCMVGLLYALPNTQLTRRLEREGRLYAGHDFVGDSTSGDQCTSGLNFETIRSRREILQDYYHVLQSAFEPSAYFARVRRVASILGTGRPPSAVKASRPRRMFGGVSLREWWQFARLCWAMTIRHPSLAYLFWSNLSYTIWKNPSALKAATMQMSLYLHMGPFSRTVLDEIERDIRALELAA